MASIKPLPQAQFLEWLDAQVRTAIKAYGPTVGMEIIQMVKVAMVELKGKTPAGEC